MIDTEGWIVKEYQKLKEVLKQMKQRGLFLEDPDFAPKSKPQKFNSPSKYRLEDSKSQAKRDSGDKLPKGHPPIKGKMQGYEEVCALEPVGIDKSFWLYRRFSFAHFSISFAHSDSLICARFCISFAHYFHTSLKTN